MELENEVIENLNEEAASEASEVIANAEGDASSGDSTSGEETPVPEAYEPNFKYRVKDEEYDFDDILKSKIANKEEEEYFRKLQAKAHGIEDVVQSRDKFKAQAGEYEPIVQEHQKLTQEIDQVFKMAERKDWDSFQKVFNFTNDDILKRAHQLLSIENLTPEQKELHNKQKEQTSSFYELERQNQEYQKQLQSMQRQFQNEQVQQRQSQLTNLLNEEGIAEKVQAFDQKHGSNVFLQEVIKRGVMHHQLNGKDATPQELVKEVMSLYGLDNYQAAPNPQIHKTNNAEKPTVIPNTGSSTATPVKQKPQSIQELKALIGKN